MEFVPQALYTGVVLVIRIATVRKFLFIIVFLCQHIALASEGMVTHLPDHSHQLLVSVYQPHTPAYLHHDHAANAQHCVRSLPCVDGVPAGHSATNTGTALSAGSGHDAGAHEHVQHVHLVADLPAESSLTFCAATQDDAYHYASQLTAITYSPPVPPPNA